MYPFWLLAFLFCLTEANSLKCLFFLNTPMFLFLRRVFLAQRNMFRPHFNLSNLSDHDPLKTVEYETLLLSLFNIQPVRYLTFVTNVFFALNVKSSFSGSTYLLSEFEPICTVHTQCYNSTGNFHFSLLACDISLFEYLLFHVDCDQIIYADQFYDLE